MSSSAPEPAAAKIPGKLPIAIGERELVFMMALTQALQALAVDAMLPALGAMSADLHVTDANHRQYVIGLFLLGAGLGALVPGALADRYGRRRVLLWSLVLYVVLTLVCGIAASFNLMVIARVIQGAICAGLTVIPPAIIRDRFEGDRMARLQSLISVIFLCVPMLAPSFGQAILLFAGWREIFHFMALLGVGMAVWVWLRLPETLDPAFRQAIRPRAILGNMAATITNRASIGYVLGSACVLGVLWGYIQSSQQLVAEHFGAGTLFPVLFGGMALAMSLGNFFNSRIVETFGARRVSHAALLAYLAMALLHVWLAWSGRETLWQFVPAMTVTMTLMGFMGANFGSIALQPFARIAGSAASVQAFVRLVAGSIIGALIGQAYDQTARPFAACLVIAGISALGLVLFSERGKLFRRLYPAGTERPA